MERRKKAIVGVNGIKSFCPHPLLGSPRMSRLTGCCWFSLLAGTVVEALMGLVVAGVNLSGCVGPAGQEDEEAMFATSRVLWGIVLGDSNNILAVITHSLLLVGVLCRMCGCPDGTFEKLTDVTNLRKK